MEKLFLRIVKNVTKKKLKEDLVNVCLSMEIAPRYSEVREYAYKFKKYDKLTMRDIDEVVAIIKRKNV